MNYSIMEIRGIAAGASLITVILLGSWACGAHAPPRIVPSIGYVVLGESGARALERSLGDTLREIDRTALARNLLQTADSLAMNQGGKTECSRFFDVGRRILLLTSPECTPPHTGEDGGTVAVLERDGQLASSPILWVPWNFFLDKRPVQRLQP